MAMFSRKPFHSMHCQILFSRKGGARFLFSATSAAVALVLAQTALAQGQGQTPAEDTAQTLPEVSVIAEDPSGYAPRSTSSATRTDTPLRQVPQSVTAVTQQILEDTGGSNVEAAMDLGGIDKGNNFGGSVTGFSIRGFTSSEYYRNGMPQGIGYRGTPDTANVESLDVVRGPASLAFGQGDPGGTFNIVTKKPQPYASYGGSLTLDSHGGRRATTELTGPLNADRTLLYSLNVALEDSDTFRDHVHINREMFAPSLSYQLSPVTRLMLDVEYQHQKTPLDRGIPALGNLLYGPPDVSFFHGEPHARRMANTNTVAQLRLEHEFSPKWQLEAGLQRMVGRLQGQSVEIRSIQADGRTGVRQHMERQNLWDSKVAQLFLRGREDIGGMQHVLLLGLEYVQGYYSIHQWSSNTRQNPMLLDVYAPVYGAQLPPVTESNYNGTNRGATALVLQDQIRLTPRLNALLGVRIDRHALETINWRRGGVRSKQKGTVTTPRLGLSYDITPQTTAYLSYSRSFKPNSGLDMDGNPFEPERGVAWEGGIKAGLFGDKAQLTASAFHITKQNVLTENPQDADYRIAAGEVRSRGVDMSLSGLVTSATRVMAHAAWVNAEVSKDNVLTPGAPLANAPRRHFAVMAMHDMGKTVKGLEVGASVRHFSERWSGSTATAFRIPGYTVADVMVNYRFTPKIALKASVKNVFNRKYMDRFSHSINGFPGAPRTLQATLQFQL